MQGSSNYWNSQPIQCTLVRFPNLYLQLGNQWSSYNFCDVTSYDHHTDTVVQHHLMELTTLCPSYTCAASLFFIRQLCASVVVFNTEQDISQTQTKAKNSLLCVYFCFWRIFSIYQNWYLWNVLMYISVKVDNQHYQVVVIGNWLLPHFDTWTLYFCQFLYFSSRTDIS